MKIETIETEQISYDTFIERFSETAFMGYIWMVEDQRKVEKQQSFIHHLYKEKQKIHFKGLNTTGSPFNKIQEAYLTNEKHAIHIKNIDGNELVFVSRLSEYKQEDLSFPSHIDGIKSIHFKQVYQLTENSISGNGFKTWQPIVKLFTGFNLKES